jgi:flagellar basal-body rod modification protein FlgD
MSTTITAPPTPVSTTPTSGAGLPSGQSLNNMFLQLLVAQLQNQDPLDPLDPSQFVGQLAQFSELSEVTSIYTLLQQLTSGATANSGSASPTGALPASAISSPGSSAFPATSSVPSGTAAAPQIR